MISHVAPNPKVHLSHLLSIPGGLNPLILFTRVSQQAPGPTDHPLSTKPPLVGSRVPASPTPAPSALSPALPCFLPVLGGAGGGAGPPPPSSLSGGGGAEAAMEWGTGVSGGGGRRRPQAAPSPGRGLGGSTAPQAAASRRRGEGKAPSRSANCALTSDSQLAAGGSNRNRNLTRPPPPCAAGRGSID